MLKHPNVHRAGRRDILAVFVLVVLWLFFFWRLWTPEESNRVMFPKGDFSYQFYAWRSLIFRELRAGRLPLWTPCIYSGYPLQADPQAALFYPPGLLVNLGAWLAGLKTFPLRLLELEAAGHIFLASLFTYAFLRVQVRHRLSALLGGVVFAYGGYLTSYPLQQMAIVESIAWFPLGLLGIWHCYQTDRRRYLWLTALAVGLSILAGHPQTAMLVVYGALAYQLYQIWHRCISWRQALRDVFFVLFIAAGFSAVQWLPSWQYMRLSTRVSLPITEAGTGFPVEDIVQFVLTGLVSLWQPLYIGIWPLLLAYVAIVGASRRLALTPARSSSQDDRWFWFGLGMIALLFSFGQNVFGFDIAYLLLPGYRLFRSQERLAFLVSFGLSILAAYGADGFASAWKRAERSQVMVAFRFLGAVLPLSFLGLILAVALHRQGIDPSDSQELPKHVGLLVLALAGSLALLSARLYDGKRRTLWSILALLLVIWNLFSVNRPLSQSPVEAPYPITRPIRLMLYDRDTFRFQDDHRLPPQAACMHGLEELEGIAPIRLAHYDRFMALAPEAVRWKLLNVKYVVTWRGSLVSREGTLVPADLVHQEGAGADVIYMYRLHEPAPRAWIVHAAYVARDESELYGYLSSPKFDPFRAAVVWEPMSFMGSPSASPLEGQEQLEIVRITPAFVQLKVRLASEGLLVLSEVTYPGWRAYVNGRPVPVREAYGILRSVVVPAGESVVEFRYYPLAFYAGAAISVCFWLALLGMVIFHMLRLRSSQANPSGERATEIHGG